MGFFLPCTKLGEGAALPRKEGSTAHYCTPDTVYMVNRVYSTLCILGIVCEQVEAIGVVYTLRDKIPGPSIAIEWAYSTCK